MAQKEGAWLGLKRKTSAGDEFYWIDDTPLAGHPYSAWDTKEPNDPHEECVQIFAASYHPGKWNDMQCSLPVSKQSRAPVVLCQKKLM